MKYKSAALCMALTALLTSPAQSATVSIVPNVLSQVVGDVFTVDVNISGLGTEIVSAFDLNIYFDNTMLAVEGSPGYTLGSGLGGTWLDLSAVAADNFDLFADGLAGIPTPTDDDLAALQTDNSFTIVTLSFRAVSAGVSYLRFGLGSNERDIVGRNAQFLQVDFNNACVAVNAAGAQGNGCAVPEPGSFGLAGLALMSALLPGVLRRRRLQTGVAG